ncbi:MAG: DoxX family protein [Bacteroidota bacterium]
MKKYFIQLITPTVQNSSWADFTLAIPRIICGYFLAVNFGASKFGLPWSPGDGANLGLFEVAAWFPEDVAAFGGIFALAPVFFAWMAAASEAIGGIFLALGLKTRFASFLLFCTMVVAIFFQKWSGGLWGMLPAMGFLWVSMYSMVLGSGKFGLDYLLSKYLKSNRKERVITPARVVMVND